jgi:peptide/nickel transport system substrate-binding protein
MILREAFDYPFSRLDPTGAHIDPPSVAIYEPLLVKGPDWQPHGLLAEGWTISDDGLEWRFELRPGLRFHSGAACDAHAILEAYELLRWEFEGAPQLWYWDPVDTATADGPGRLVFRLHYPYARLPSLLWGTHTAVHHEALRRAEGDRFGHEVADGTGPYRLVSWSPERVVAERWEPYPEPLPAFLREAGRSPERIEWIAIVDPADRLAALEAGEVHSLHGPPLEDVDRLRAEGRFEIVEFPQQSNAYLALDFRQQALGFDDVRVRRAISEAIDREALVRDVLHGHGAPSFGPVPPGDEHHAPAVDAAGRFDREGAARTLDELGWERGPDGVRRRGDARLAFRCICQDDAVLRPLAEAVRDQLQAIGVELALEPIVPFQPFYEAATAGSPAIMSKWLWPDPIDAAIGFSATHTVPTPNWQHASVPALDAAYDAWLRAPADGLMAAAERVQRTFADELPYIPLVTPNDVWVHRRELTGYRPFKANLYPFYQPVRLA